MTGLAGLFGNKNVGTGKTVTVSAGTLGGNDAGNYTFTLGSATDTADITAKALTIGGTFTVNNKVYDGNTTASILANNLFLIGVIGGENVILTSPNAYFANANVGTAKTVSLASAALGGTANLGNYTLSLSGAPVTTANITSGVTPPPPPPPPPTSNLPDILPTLILTMATLPPPIPEVKAPSLSPQPSSAGNGPTVPVVMTPDNSPVTTDIDTSTTKERRENEIEPSSGGSGCAQGVVDGRTASFGDHCL